MKYRLWLTNNLGQIANPHNGETLCTTGDISDDESAKYYREFEDMKDIQEMAKEWLLQYPKCLCLVFLGEEEVAVYSYESFY